MNVHEALAQLESFGAEQTRKVYRRHGVQGAQFGVSYANLKAMAKKIKRDHDLACGLWASGNHDARVLATMVADPKAMTKKSIDDWAKGLDNYVIADAFGGLVSETDFAREKAAQWTASDQEFTGQVGWRLVSRLARDESLPDEYFKPYLETIEREIHSRKNRTRHSMNGALIAIGIRSAALEKAAIAASRRIGVVQVDHGETSCKTPDAVAYIKKARGRVKKKA